MTELAVLESSPPASGGLEFGKKIRLEEDFEEQLEFRVRNRHELGRIARELKRHYLFNGAGNGWTAYIGKQGLEVRTVDRWIEDFEIKEGIRPAKDFGQNVRSFSDSKDLEPGTHDSDSVVGVVPSAEIELANVSDPARAGCAKAPSATRSKQLKKTSRKKPQVFNLEDHRKATRAIAINQVKAYLAQFKTDPRFLRLEMGTLFREIADALVSGFVVELKEAA